MDSGLRRPEPLDVLPVEVASEELAAVRALLLELGGAVDEAERTAEEVERRANAAGAGGTDATLLAVERLAATRRAEMRAIEAEARRAAAQQVYDATIRAQALAEASRRDATRILDERIRTGERVDHWIDRTVQRPAHMAPPRPTPTPPPPPQPQHAVPPQPQFAPRVVPPPAQPQSAPIAQPQADPSPTIPASPQPATPAVDAHAQFWSETHRVDSARDQRIQKVVKPFAPLEALLPTIAMVILLMAVLLLIG